MKHTQGPWTVKPARNPDAESDPLGQYVIEEAERKLFALEDASMDAEPGSAGEQDALDERNAMNQANVHLISAAPDLLAALEACVTADVPGESCGLSAEKYNIACAAIAKATGR